MSPSPPAGITSPGPQSPLRTPPAAGAGAGAGAAAGAVLLPVVELDVEFTAAAGEVDAEMLTPTPSSPFMPAAAWPGTAQRNSYLPFFETITVSVADWPAL